jgi:hypothetical protein
MEAVHPVVAERIRRPMPLGQRVLERSLPIVSFGDARKATVATLSLNPSWIEFESQNEIWLEGSARRVASLASIGVDDPRNLTDEQVAQVVAESNAYFNGPNWYKAWFHWLESLLVGSGAGSYMDGTACHLDLVQWATKPAQGKLAPSVWEPLVEKDTPFLRWQLENGAIKVVLMNGTSVVRWVHKAGLLGAAREEALTYSATTGTKTMRVRRGSSDGVLFLGWNRPLAGALSSDGRARLINWVRAELKQPV